MYILPQTNLLNSSLYSLCFTWNLRYGWSVPYFIVVALLGESRRQCCQQQTWCLLKCPCYIALSILPLPNLLATVYGLISQVCADSFQWYHGYFVRWEFAKFLFTLLEWHLLPLYPSIGLLQLSCISYLFQDDISSDSIRLGPNPLAIEGQRLYLPWVQ